MAGRGRGRGRGLSFNIESLGFGRGDSLPAASQEPPPLYPPLQFKPAPLKTGEELDYLLALKQEFRGTVRESPFFIKPLERRRDVERYSDKYQLNQNGDSNIRWEPDWTRFPAELAAKKKRVGKKTVVAAPKLVAKKGDVLDKMIDKTLEDLAKKEAKQGDESGEEDEAAKSEDEEENEGEEELELGEDEEFEEETDYNLNYFDNGENYGNDDEDDALDDGPVY
ncbi:DNA-directed RNA polymerase III subunit RPC7-like [Lineus longissimus]|uniref:DNA-directed RNA polymerase III subunit RPC7-like n=1 Tax=Lineus longissimus TaxID=88925 RepID=UPI002B4D24E3